MYYYKYAMSWTFVFIHDLIICHLWQVNMSWLKVPVLLIKFPSVKLIYKFNCLFVFANIKLIV